MAVGGSRGIATDGSRGDSGIGTDGEGAARQVFHAFSSHEDKYDIGALNSNLPAETPAGEGDELGESPGALRIADQDDAMTAAAGSNEADLDDVWNNGDGLGLSKQIFGNSVGWN